MNALLIDPKRIWKGVWRWYDDSMLDCCEPIDLIKLNGITLAKLACVARCNSATVELVYGVECNVEQFRSDVQLACSKRMISKYDADVENSSTSTSTGTGSSGGTCCDANAKGSTSVPTTTSSSTTTTTTTITDPNTNININTDTDTPTPPLLPPPAAQYERHITCCDIPLQQINKVIICSYHRGTLNQTGTGHFSPIGGYNAESDLVLIMDVARFKYTPHWVPLAELYKAMCVTDPSSNKSRGYMCISSTEELLSYCQCHSVSVDISVGTGVGAGVDSGVDTNTTTTTTNSTTSTTTSNSTTNKRKRQDSSIDTSNVTNPPNKISIEEYKSHLHGLVNHECELCCSHSCK